VLGYAAAGVALILGFSIGAAFLTLVGTGMATVLLVATVPPLRRLARLLPQTS
jgi:hypothetical protein